MSDYKQALARALTTTERDVTSTGQAAMASTDQLERARLVGQLEGIERVLGYFDDEFAVMDMENSL